jgi:hypothetical protein
MSSAPTESETPTYVDASAFVKLVVSEPESEALRRFLVGAPRRLTSSALLEVEAGRAGRAVGGDAAVGMAEELAGVNLVEVTSAIRSRARTLDPVDLRTLDAIHLATALEAGVRDVLVYDRRLGAAAASYGLNVLAPGA